MKNAKSYESKIRKLLTEARKQKIEAKEVTIDDRIALIVEAILADDASPEQVRAARKAIDEEFVDLNELRVCMPREIDEVLGDDMPHAREKSEMIANVLHGIYGRASAMSIEYMQQYGKREVRRHLQELGLSPFAEALVALTLFDVHAVPVDQALVDALIVTGHVDEETDIADTQSFLERVISQKDDMTAHVYFRKFIRENQKAIGKKRDEEAKVRAAEQAAARKAAEEAAKKAEDAAKAKAAAEAQKQAEQAKQAEAKNAKAAKAKAAKKTPPAKKKATKTTKKKKAPKAKAAKKKTSKKKTTRASAKRKTPKTKAKKVKAKKKTAKKKTARKKSSGK